MREVRSSEMTSLRPLLPGYRAQLPKAESRDRYDSKLAFANGSDPYEMPMNEWVDYVEMWPATTSVHIAMYLIVSPSPYTGEALQNYKSLDCYLRFVSGWVYSLLVSVVPSNGNRIVTAKVWLPPILFYLPLVGIIGEAL